MRAVDELGRRRAGRYGQARSPGGLRQSKVGRSEVRIIDFKVFARKRTMSLSHCLGTIHGTSRRAQRQSSQDHQNAADAMLLTGARELDVRQSRNWRQ